LDQRHSRIKKSKNLTNEIEKAMGIINQFFGGKDDKTLYRQGFSHGIR
jgi:hypothetical protein